MPEPSPDWFAALLRALDPAALLDSVRGWISDEEPEVATPTEIADGHWPYYCTEAGEDPTSNSEAYTLALGNVLHFTSTAGTRPEFVPPRVTISGRSPGRGAGDDDGPDPVSGWYLRDRPVGGGRGRKAWKPAPAPTRSRPSPPRPDGAEVDAYLKRRSIGLPDRLLEVGLMFWGLGKTAGAIASALGISLRTAQNHIGRLRRRIRRDHLRRR